MQCNATIVSDPFPCEKKTVLQIRISGRFKVDFLRVSGSHKTPEKSLDIVILGSFDTAIKKMCNRPNVTERKFDFKIYSQYPPTLRASHRSKEFTFSFPPFNRPNSPLSMARQVNTPRGRKPSQEQKIRHNRNRCPIRLGSQREGTYKSNTATHNYPIKIPRADSQIDPLNKFSLKLTRPKVEPDQHLRLTPPPPPAFFPLAIGRLS